MIKDTLNKLDRDVSSLSFKQNCFLNALTIICSILIVFPIGAVVINLFMNFLFIKHLLLICLEVLGIIVYIITGLIITIYYNILKVMLNKENLSLKGLMLHELKGYKLFILIQVIIIIIGIIYLLFI